VPIRSTPHDAEDHRVELAAPTRSVRVPRPAFPVNPPAEVQRKYFAFAPLDAYSARQRTLIKLADRSFYGLISAIGPTMTWSFDGGEHLDRLYRSGRHAIFAFWHNVIFYNTWFWRDRGIVVMTSQSFDGEYIARFIQRFGYGAARGSSSRGGVRALLGLDAALRAGYDAAFTVDGPRGPRHEAKPGPILLAKRSGHGIVPTHVTCSAYWELGSWDRFQIPKPFARAHVRVTEPIFVPADAGEARMDTARLELQKALDELRTGSTPDTRKETAHDSTTS
jgi:lysophospholipid acyltransferase (LPLAT)-like uncharacterized protein